MSSLKGYSVIDILSTFLIPQSAIRELALTVRRGIRYSSRRILDFEKEYLWICSK
jgi:hypothetical protein